MTCIIKQTKAALGKCCSVLKKNKMMVALVLLIIVIGTVGGLLQRKLRKIPGMKVVTNTLRGGLYKLRRSTRGAVSGMSDELNL